jgi:trans-aconitate 2-methyltransferase
MWDPEVYLRFAAERGRPFHELVARIGAREPRKVVDLGCGPGNLTETLKNRWPGAVIEGVDWSREMIAEAQATTTGVEYVRADVRDYRPGDDVDVLITNAVLQWVPDHERLLEIWALKVPWVAMQVPGNHHEPAHVMLRELCTSAKWRHRLGDLKDRVGQTGDPRDYARVLRIAGCDHVDAWETTYLHQLPVVAGKRHPVLEWLSGTGMRPVRQALDDTEWQDFCDDYEVLLRRGYPGKYLVDFAFRRVFAVGHRNA